MENLIRRIEELKNKYSGEEDLTTFQELSELLDLATIAYLRNETMKSDILSKVDSIKEDVQRQ